MFIPRNWLITGGCGFIGRALIREILGTDPLARIRVLDNLSVGTRDDLGRVCDFAEAAADEQQAVPSLSSATQAVQLFVGDITDAGVCTRACQETDIVVHLAANTGVYPSVLDPLGDCTNNVLGTLYLLEASRQASVQGFVFASSGAPIGEVDPPVHEDMAPRPVSPYGAGKLAGEGYCSAYFRTFGLKTAALRFGNVYGPGSTHKTSVVAKFIKQALQGEPCRIYGDGTQTRDFIYIQDLIRAILTVALFDSKGIDAPLAGSAASCPKPVAASPWGEIYHIATNTEHTVNEMARMLKACLHSQGQEMHIEHVEAQPGDIKRTYADTSKAKQRLGWTYQVDLQDGLQRTVRWFLHQTGPMAPTTENKG